MKKIIIFLLVVFLLSFPSLASAQTKEITLESDQVTEGDYFAAAERVIISGTVNGDLYAAGGEILIDGTVNGDALISGGSIKIHGTIEQDLRAVAGEIIIQGLIGKNASIGSGNLTVSKDAVINGNLVLGAGNADISGALGGDLTAGAGQLMLSGPITGNVKAGVGNLILNKDAKINGFLTYWSESDATIANNESVVGEIVKKAPPQQFSQKVNNLKTKQPKASLITGIISFLSFLLLGFVIISLLPKLPEKIIKTLSQKPWASLGWGFATLFLTPLAAILMFITILGIPLGFLTITFYAVLIFLSKIFVSFWLGSLVAKSTDKKLSPYWQFVIGLFALYILLMIPVIKVFTKIAVLLLGLGSSVLSLNKSYITSKKK